MENTPTTTGSKGMNIGLWVAQILLAGAFGLFGSMKAMQPLDQLVPMMKWIPSFQPWFVRALGTAEVLGAIGLILPSLTRIMPRLTVAAAVGLAFVQVSGIVLHATRGETAQTIPLNLVLLGLAVFIIWGRSRKAVIAPRG